MKEIKLRVEIVSEFNVDTEEDLANLTRNLRNELLELDISDAEFLAQRKAPRDAKSGSAITWGTLLVTLAASGGVLTTLVNTVTAWLRRNEGRSVILELNGNKLELTGLSADEQQELVKVWLGQNRGFILPNE